VETVNSPLATGVKLTILLHCVCYNVADGVTKIKVLQQFHLPVAEIRAILVAFTHSHVTHGPYLSILEIKGLYIKRYINSPVYFTFQTKP